MISVVAQAPYKICNWLSGALSNQACRKGTRLGRCERTRSITTLRGQGRNTVRTASRIIAKPAQHSGLQEGRRSGRRHSTQTFIVLCFGELSNRLLPFSTRRTARRKIELPHPSLNLQKPAASPRDFHQMAKRELGSVPPQQLGLVIHPRVPIFDVQRVDIDHRFRVFKTKAKHQPFRPAVAGAKCEVSNAVKDWAATVDFKGLDDMGMMTHNGVGAALYREMGFRSSSG